MKTKNLKKVLSLALLGSMMVSMLGACGNSSEKSGSSAGKASTASTGKSSTASGQTADGKPSTWIADRTINIQAYVDDIGYSLPKDFNNTPVMQELTKRTGIKLNIQYTPGDSDAKVLASQLAAGTIPDVIISYLDDSTRPEFPLLLKAAKEGMFADVSAMMKDSQVYKKYYAEGYLPRDSYKNIVFREEFGDAVYLLPMKIEEVDRSAQYIPEDAYLGGPYIQKSIVDKLGIDPTSIRTSEDFYNLLVKIKKGGFKDDNGNDVWPLGPKYWGGSYDSLAFNIGELNWGVSGKGSLGGYNIDKKDGKIKHEAETDYVYDKINYVRKLIKEGLMNPEYFTMDQTRAEEVSKSHNSAIIADVHNYENIIFQTNDWVPLGPLNNVSGDNKGVVSGKTQRGCWAISSQAENPEEIFKFFDYLSTYEGQLLAEYGVEGLSYNLKDGKPVITEEVSKKLNDGDVDWLINSVGAAFGGTANYFFEFMLTNVNHIDNFGESRPGSGSGSAFKRSVESAKEYPREYKVVPGLKATAYLTSTGLEDVKAQMDLLNYQETLIQAFFAKDDAEVKSIIEAFRNQLQSAGNDQFKAKLEELHKEDPQSIQFY